MAIYSGNWLDEAGAPFDPDAFSRSGSANAQIAQVRRRGRTHRIYKSAFRHALGRAAHHWRFHLTEAEREIFGWATAGYPTDRDENQSVNVHPFAGWAQSFFVDFFTGRTPDTDDFAITLINQLNITLDQADASAQTITITQTVDEADEFPPTAALLLFQVRPTRNPSTAKRRYTRLLTLFTDYVPYQQVYQIVSDARFPFAAGETVRVLTMYRSIIKEADYHDLSTVAV